MTPANDAAPDVTAAGLVLPVPTFSFAVLVGAVQVFLIGGMPMVLELDVGSAAVIAGSVAASLCIYAGLLILFARGDPRAWRRREWSRPTAQASGDVTRALLWRHGSAIMGRQAGCLAGLVAASSASLRSDLAAAATLVVVGCVVGTTVYLAVSLPDRRTLGPLAQNEGS